MMDSLIGGTIDERQFKTEQNKMIRQFREFRRFFRRSLASPALEPSRA